MVALLPLLSLATAVLAAPPMADLLILTGREADYGSDYGSNSGSEYSNHNGSDYGNDYGSDYGSNYGSDFGSNMRMADDGSDYGSDNGSDYGSEDGSDFGSNMRMSDDGSDYGSEYGSNYGSDYGSDYGSNMRMDDDGSMTDYGSEYGSEAEDFVNLTMSRAAEERAINTCSCATVSSSDRIVGGNEVNPKYKLPYQVLVSPCNKEGHCFMCGGTILNKRYVVTAAHCLYAGKDLMTLKGGSKFRVMLGEHDHCKATSSFVLASTVHKHPKFDINSASVDNDIAILKLSKDLTFSDKIKPVCLPTSATKDYSGKASTVSGWGGTKAYTPMKPVDQPRQCALKEAIVDILKPSSTKCSNFLGDSSSTTRLCAWGKGKDACQGDSGGPLTVAENGKYVLLGVVSYGSGCATENPGVYARVQGFLPWMKKIISDGECSSSGATTTGSSATTASSATTTAAPATTTDYGNYGNYGDYNYEG